MGHVGDRIIDLPLVERAARPVGEPRSLVERVTQHAFDEIGVANLLAIAERHSRVIALDTLLPTDSMSVYDYPDGGEFVLPREDEIEGWIEMVERNPL